MGLASYLLIGYFHTQKKAANASLEAFTLKRIGDWFFLFGIIASFYHFGTLNIVEIFSKLSGVDKALLGLACLLLFWWSGRKVWAVATAHMATKRQGRANACVSLATRSHHGTGRSLYGSKTIPHV